MFRNRYYVVVECLMLMSICPNDDDDAARYSLAMQKRPTNVLHIRGYLQNYRKTDNNNIKK